MQEAEIVLSDIEELVRRSGHAAPLAEFVRLGDYRRCREKPAASSPKNGIFIIKIMELRLKI